MWHSVFNLLLQAFNLAVKDRRTTALALGGGFALFLLKQISIWRSTGFGAMKKDRKKDAVYGALLTAGLWLCLFLSFALKTVYGDRQGILMRAHAAEVARDTYKQIVSDRDATIEEMEKDRKDSCRPNTSQSAASSIVIRRSTRSSGARKVIGAEK